MKARSPHRIRSSSPLPLPPLSTVVQTVDSPSNLPSSIFLLDNVWNIDGNMTDDAAILHLLRCQSPVLGVTTIDVVTPAINELHLETAV